MIALRGFEGRYSVTPEGDIFSHLSGKILKQARHATHQGKFYRRVRLRIDGRYVPLYIHRILAEIHIPNPDNKPTVNHKNGDTEDNSLCNLEWSTHKEQTDHAFETGIRTNFGDNASWTKLSEEDVREIRSEYRAGVKQKELAERFNTTQPNISMIVNNHNRVREIQ